MTQMYYWVQMRNGDKHTCGYIEERGAHVGYKVELVDLDGEMWEVMSVAETPVTKEYVRNNEKRYKAFQTSTRGGGIDEKISV